MRARGPILTLLAVVVLAGILLAINLTKSPAGDPTAQPAAQPAAAPAVPGPAPAVPGPGPAAPAPTAPGAAPPAAPGAAPPAATESFPGQAKYTGYTDGNHAALAVTVRNNKVSAYLCDGKAIEGWYQGSSSGGTLGAKGRGTNELTGSLSGGKLSGTVSAAGKSWTYTAAPAAAPAGLYRSKTASGTTGWVKDSTGQVTGLTNKGGVSAPAPPLDPATAQSVEGGDQVVGQ
jgi:serine/threonine-protein kinase